MYHKKCQQGFVFIEMLLVLVLFGLFSVGLSTVLLQSKKLEKLGKEEEKKIGVFIQNKK